jgi:hypothetical protein
LNIREEKEEREEGEKEKRKMEKRRRPITTGSTISFPPSCSTPFLLSSSLSAFFKNYTAVPAPS